MKSVLPGALLIDMFTFAPCRLVTAKPTDRKRFPVNGAPYADPGIFMTLFTFIAPLRLVSNRRSTESYLGSRRLEQINRTSRRLFPMIAILSADAAHGRCARPHPAFAAAARR